MDGDDAAAQVRTRAQGGIDDVEVVGGGTSGVVTRSANLMTRARSAPTAVGRGAVVVITPTLAEVQV